MSELKGSSTDFLYYWDEVYGWIHVSEKDKMKEAYERWIKENRPNKLFCSSPDNDSYFMKLWRNKVEG